MAAEQSEIDYVTAICGAISCQGNPGLPSDLEDVIEGLAPYGLPTRWDGQAGRFSVAVAAVQTRQRAALASGISRGSQDDVVVCGDLRLHGRQELRSSLGDRTPTDATDADLIVAGYERWGTELLGRLSGSFAFVVVDKRRGGVFLARDHSGSRFLAVHQRPGVLAFASTALSLTGFPGVGHELDTERAAEIIVLGYGTERSLVRGVTSILPGTALWVDAAGVRSWRWWMPDGSPVDDTYSLADQAASLRACLERAVEDSLVGAQQPGVLLSGGLDSSSVAAVAARQTAPRRLLSYTSVPPPGWSGTTEPGWIADERFAVDALAARLPSLTPNFVHARGLSIFDHNEMLWELGAGPIRNPLNMVWVVACYRDAAADGVDVLMSGGAGNMAFSADGPLWLAELARRGRLTRAWREASQWAAARGKKLEKVLRGELLWPLLPYGVRHRRATARGLDELTAWLRASAILPDRLSGIDLETVLSRQVKPHPKGFTRDTVRIFNVPAAQAESDAAVEALFGFELRDPTVDRRLVELCLRQPEWLRRHAGVNRAICRAAMRDILPTEIVDRVTLGAQMPDWLDRMSDARDEITEELHAMQDHPPTTDLVDVRRLQQLVASWPQRGTMADMAVLYDYQCALSRAILVSRYLRWFEGHGRRVASGGPRAVVHAPFE